MKAAIPTALVSKDSTGGLSLRTPTIVVWVCVGVPGVPPTYGLVYPKPGPDCHRASQDRLNPRGKLRRLDMSTLSRHVIPEEFWDEFACQRDEEESLGLRPVAEEEVIEEMIRQGK